MMLIFNQRVHRFLVLPLVLQDNREARQLAFCNYKMRYIDNVSYTRRKMYKQYFIMIMYASGIAVIIICLSDIDRYVLHFNTI
jgi:hypothetical protein